jgi:2-oxoglutarate dehydrogenase E2 component (dihydrolipoamide succinyltransferase)
MSTEVRVPALPESVADATVLSWHKQPGEAVRRDENLVDLETDKVVLEVPAPGDGVLAAISANEGDVVQANAVLGLLDAAAAGVARETTSVGQPPVKPSTAPAPVPGASAKASPARPPASDAATSTPPRIQATETVIAPAARRLVKELKLDPTKIKGSGKDGRVLKSDVMKFLDTQETDRSRDDVKPFRPEPRLEEKPGLGGTEDRPEQRVPMTRLRTRVAERLVQAQQTAAILTTFNEVDMRPVMDLRARYKERFERAHQVRLGFMSFFVKAAVEALKRFPVVNASVDGGDIIYHGYYDIGIAVSSPRGLVVPILRDCDEMGFADIEKGIADFGMKAKEGTLSYDDLTGGTFSITNGGIFGSLLSTPIINPPQSAILGMHAIKERAMVENGQVVVRPAMYLALSYDHRIIDGREAVQTLVTIKDCLEDPSRLLLQV